MVFDSTRLLRCPMDVPLFRRKASARQTWKRKSFVEALWPGLRRKGPWPKNRRQRPETWSLHDPQWVMESKPQGVAPAVSIYLHDLSPRKKPKGWQGSPPVSSSPDVATVAVQLHGPLGTSGAFREALFRDLQQQLQDRLSFTPAAPGPHIAVDPGERGGAALMK